MQVHLRVSQAAKVLGVCVKTIHRWDISNKIQCYRTPGGHRRIAITEIRRLQNKNLIQKYSKGIAIYGRVSSHDQKKKGDLQRQIDKALQAAQLTTQAQTPIYIFHDVASGLNTKRKGLNKLFRSAEQGSIDKIIVTYPDRLTRFGFDYLQRYFASYGVSIKILEQKASQSVYDELVQDVIAIITSFSGRIHGLRNRKRKIQKPALTASTT